MPHVSGTHSVFIALGSNLGDSTAIIQQALEELESISAAPLLRSSLIRTMPLDCPPGSPGFINAAAGLAPKPHETPESLMAKLQAIEKELGRRPKTVLNEPRPIDLDLIAFGTEVRDSSELSLPHPRAHLRRFVLQPLVEIAPKLILSGQTRTIAELLRVLVPEQDG